MRNCAEFVVGRERRLGGYFATAIRAGGVCWVGQVGDAGKRLAEMICRSVEADREGGVVRCLPIAAS